MSRAYQLSSHLTHPSQADAKRFARMSTKGLTGHQIFDSLNSAAGRRTAQNQAESMQSRRFASSEVQGGNRGEFVSRFPQSNRRTEAATSILQSLMLMNGKYISDMLAEDKNPLLAQLGNSSSESNEIVETLFLAILGRTPNSAEREKFTIYLDTGGPSEDWKQGIADVFWVATMVAQAT